MPQDFDHNPDVECNPFGPEQPPVDYRAHQKRLHDGLVDWNKRTDFLNTDQDLKLFRDHQFELDSVRRMYAEHFGYIPEGEIEKLYFDMREHMAAATGRMRAWLTAMREVGKL